MSNALEVGGAVGVPLVFCKIAVSRAADAAGAAKIVGAHRVGQPSPIPPGIREPLMLRPLLIR